LTGHAQIVDVSTRSSGSVVDYLSAITIALVTIAGIPISTARGGVLDEDSKSITSAAPVGVDHRIHQESCEDEYFDREGHASLRRIDMRGSRTARRSVHGKGRCTWSIPIPRFPIVLRVFVGERRLSMCAHRQEIRNDAQCAQDHKECKTDDDDDGK
jgi:hypothetical protein